MRNPNSLCLLGVRVGPRGGERFDVTLEDGRIRAIVPHEPESTPDASDILDYRRSFQELWPSFVEGHAHLALSPYMDRALSDPPWVIAAQYLLSGVTRVIDLFGFPKIQGQWEKEAGDADFAFPEVLHSGYAFTSGLREGMKGHGHEYPVKAHLIDTDAEIERGLEENLASGARIAKVMYTSGRDLPPDPRKFSLFARPELRRLRERLDRAGIPAVIDCNTYDESRAAFDLGYRHFAHMIRDRALTDAEWDGFRGARFLSTLSGLTPMVHKDEDFLAASDRELFHATQSPLHRAAMRTVKIPYGEQIGIQASRLGALAHISGNLRAALAREQVVLGSDAGNMNSFHGFGAHREMEMLLRQELASDTRLHEAATTAGHRFFEDLRGGDADRVGLEVGDRADLNLLTRRPGATPLVHETYLRGQRLDRDSLLARLRARWEAV
jgi:hypothetical protein